MKELALNITFIEKTLMITGKLQEKILSFFYTKKNRLTSSSIYQNLKYINIQLWVEILETGNVLLLDKKFSETKKYNLKELELINSKFNELYDLFFNLLNNQYAKANLVDNQQRAELSAKILILTECLKSLTFIAKYKDIIDDSFVKELDILESVKKISKNVKFNAFNTIYENIKIIIKLIESHDKTYLRKYGEENKKKDFIKYSFEKQVVEVEQVLGRSIDLKSTNVIKWIELTNLATEISKRNKDGNKR